MIERGHGGVWDYGFNFFLVALDESERMAAERVKDAAFAVRMGRFADAKEWKKFIRPQQEKREATPGGLPLAMIPKSAKGFKKLVSKIGSK
jgi:hypothetical protein